MIGKQGSAGSAALWGCFPRDDRAVLYGACLVFRGMGDLEGPRRWAAFCSARLSPYGMAALWRDAIKHRLCPVPRKSRVFGDPGSVFAGGSCPFPPGPRRALTRIYGAKSRSWGL